MMTYQADPFPPARLQQIPPSRRPEQHGADKSGQEKHEEQDDQRPHAESLGRITRPVNQDHPPTTPRPAAPVH
jgi:hypothetical protein